jgi:phosphatidylserine/phosphatidylglycerophosphate/cardiolipin synthase-like enzyme
MNNIKLLNTDELTNEIRSMIRNEKDFVLLLSPFISLRDNLVADFNLSKASIVLIISEGDKNNIDDLKKLLPEIEIVRTKNLHAKIYMSPSKIIVATMNLYKYSQDNNFELGFIIDYDKDNEICQGIYKEIENFFEQNKGELNKDWLERLYYTKRCLKCNKKIADKFIVCGFCHSKKNNKKE